MCPLNPHQLQPDNLTRQFRQITETMVFTVSFASMYDWLNFTMNIMV